MKELIYPTAKNLQSFQTLDRFFIFNLYRADGTATAKKKKMCLWLIKCMKVTRASRNGENLVLSNTYFSAISACFCTFPHCFFFNYIWM